jgi:hypothetical protein
MQSIFTLRKPTAFEIALDPRLKTDTMYHFFDPKEGRVAQPPPSTKE